MQLKLMGIFKISIKIGRYISIYKMNGSLCVFVCVNIIVIFILAVTKAIINAIILRN